LREWLPNTLELGERVFVSSNNFQRCVEGYCITPACPCWEGRETRCSRIHSRHVLNMSINRSQTVVAEDTRAGHMADGICSQFFCTQSCVAGRDCRKAHLKLASS
jgi:hypothetical protein